MAAPIGKLVDRDRGYKRIKRDFKRAARGPNHVDIGLFENGRGGNIHRKSTLTIAAIGGVHEFGVGVPERSWLRSTEGAERATNQKIVERIAKGLLDGAADVGSKLRDAGERFLGKVQQRIRANIPPPLSAATIRRKGHDLALVDTEEFIDSIEVRVGRS